MMPAHASSAMPWFRQDGGHRYGVDLVIHYASCVSLSLNFDMYIYIYQSINIP